jgi:hypothetical protein
VAGHVWLPADMGWDRIKVDLLVKVLAGLLVSLLREWMDGMGWGAMGWVVNECSILLLHKSIRNEDMTMI